jgi:cyclopropane-fatty-acyl-phospholipid synthase
MVTEVAAPPRPKGRLRGVPKPFKVHATSAPWHNAGTEREAMTRSSRIEPLGVPVGDNDLESTSAKPERGGQPPTRLDRWLAQQLNDAVGEERIHIALWDESLPDGPGERAIVRLADRAALVQLLVNPELHFGDLYSAGRIEVVGDLLHVLLDAYHYVQRRREGRWRQRARIPTPDFQQSRRNIHHHYDIGNEFYRLWLDREALQYTCAYYADRAMTIEQAQQAKLHHVCRKMWLERDERVVEAGSGWGGLALFMAKHYGVKVRSFNISGEQIAFARDWARREQLEDRVEFVEDDYRNISGRYDAFVSVGMLEHVGVGNYRDLGRLIDRSLEPHGRGLIHSIGRDRIGNLNPWIDKRIFPGAYPATLRQMTDIFEPSGLSVLDVENLRLHYARTLEAWLERYEGQIDVVRSMFDEPFVRAWRLYLTGSIAAFLTGSLQLFQIVFSRSAANNIPWNRAYLYDQARILRA